MDSREYLNYVLDKLQERIRKLDDAILHGRRRFKKMLDSPFFGRVDFIYDGEEEAETF